MNEIEALYRAGFAWGEAKGFARARAREKGEAEGLAKALLRILERRFGTLSPEVRDRVSSAPLEQLRQWIDGVLYERSLRETLDLPSTP